MIELINIDEERRDPRFQWLRDILPAAYRIRVGNCIEWAYSLTPPVRPEGPHRLRRMFSGKQLVKAYWIGVRAAGGQTPEDDPMAHEAGAVEFQSWRNVLMDERDNCCPDGDMHELESMNHTGYFLMCLQCGHHLDMPF